LGIPEGDVLDKTVYGFDGLGEAEGDGSVTGYRLVWVKADKVNSVRRRYRACEGDRDEESGEESYELHGGKEQGKGDILYRERKVPVESFVTGPSVGFVRLTLVGMNPHFYLLT
jgi:hypothetical protein